MISQALYSMLGQDFILQNCSDDWSNLEFNDYYTESFQRSYMGLVLDNTEKIESVYTAVFPSENVLEKLCSSDISNALLFTHHPMIWNISGMPAFTGIPDKYLESLAKRHISLYTLHTPLDKNGTYSTSVNLAKAVHADMVGEFYQNHGCNVGAYCITNHETVHELKQSLESAIGHEAKLYLYGDEEIKRGTAAFVAGGGNDVKVYEILAEKGLNTFVTGVAADNTGYSPAVEAHEAAKAYGINIISGTHYSTEKFACIKMVKYFKKIGLPCEFVEDTPDFLDM